MSSVIVILILSGCPLLPENLSSFKDCSDDDACMEAAIKNCEKAYLRKVEEDSELKISSRITVYGLQQEKCKITFKMESVEAKTEEGKQMAAVMGPMMLAAEITCMIPEEELGTMDDLGSEKMEEYCSSPILEQFIQES